MKIIILLMLLFAAPAMAQIPIPLTWDASATPSTPENPINYRVYKCTNDTMVACEQEEAGTATEFSGFMQVHAEQAYYHVTAWNYDIESENLETGEVVLGDLQESMPSNRLRVKVNQPPGNPDNIKIKVQSYADLRGKSVIDSAWNYKKKKNK